MRAKHGCKKCKGTECCCKLESTRESKGGKAIMPERDVWVQTHAPIGYRLARGFSLMHGHTND